MKVKEESEKVCLKLNIQEKLRSWLPVPSVKSVQSFSHVRLFATPWITARQASLSITNSRSLLKLMPIKSVMPFSHLILFHPLLLLPPVPPSIRVFSNESSLHGKYMRKQWNQWQTSFSWAPKSLQAMTAAIKLKDASSLEENFWQTQTVY